MTASRRAVRTLVIDTATAACSVALVEGDTVIDRSHAVVGRGHAERLVPMIAGLERGGRAGAILVDVGPGSFTGLRVGIAAARGLALGWGVEAHGYLSTWLLAAAARAVRPAGMLAVVMEGGHGELFMHRFAPHAPIDDQPVSLSPQAALERVGDGFVVGSGLAALRALDPAIIGSEALPDAADAVRLSADAQRLPPVPFYGRAPDAKPQAAR